jgi:hypothetical protein
LEPAARQLPFLSSHARKAAKAAGLEISKVEIDRSGKIVIIIGSLDMPHDTKEIFL